MATLIACLTNDFHRTRYRVDVSRPVTAAHVRRIRRALCVDGCSCPESDLGTRGMQTETARTYIARAEEVMGTGRDEC